MLAHSIGDPRERVYRGTDHAVYTLTLGLPYSPRPSLIQTPQTFDRKLLLEAYDRLKASGDRNITDDTMIVERYMDVKSKVIEGSYKNMKVTTPEDMIIAEAYLEAGKDI